MKLIYDRFFLYQQFENDRKIITLDNKHISIDELTDHYFLEFYNWAIKNTFLEKEEPILFWRNYGYIHQLDNLIYNKETVDYLNRVGLKIYLYEFSIFYEGNMIQPLSPDRTDTNQSYLSKIYKNRFHDCIDDNKLNPIRCYDFDSIEKFVKNNNLSNVKVLTCHYNINKFFQKKYPSFKIVTNNCCIPGLVDRLLSEYTENLNYDNFTKKFFVPVFRYSSTRHLVLSYLFNKDDMLASWYYKGSIDILKNNLWFDLEKWKISYKNYYDSVHQGVKKLDISSPLILDDINGGKVTELDGNFDHFKFPPDRDGYFVTNKMAEFYQECFCTIVIESIFAQPMSIISEKILTPIICKRPFILIGGPYSLEYLKKLGFKTFDRWWDESYDQEEDHEKRMIKIFNTIDIINQFSMSKLKMFYEEMEDIINHNYNRLSKLRYINLEM